jgi:predicted nucleic acid-binding protein
MAAAIRAGRRTSLPDALHVATAALAGCSVLVTHDTRMASLPSVEVIQLQDLEELSG